MKVKFARAVLVALLVLLMAVTPLAAILSGGVFETSLPGEGSGYPSRPRVRVLLYDQTGLMRAIAPANPDQQDAPNPRVLVVEWTGGCGDFITRLTFRRTDDGFVIEERTEESGCMFLIGYGRAVALHLWAPVDQSTVRFESLN